LKKSLIEDNKLDVPQAELEQRLFACLRAGGFDETYIERYKMLSRFYQKRVPLLIIIGGTFCIGKSILATNLAERLNISNVLQTDIVEVIMNKLDPRYSTNPIHLKSFASSEQLIQEYQDKCRLARKGFNTDIQKCLKEGKPLIIEGFSVDLNLYISKETIVPSPPLTPEEIDAKRRLLREFIDKNKELDLSVKGLMSYNVMDYGKSNFKVIMPDPGTQKEEQLEKAREKVIRKEMKAIDQKGAIIVPLLFVINSRDHRYNLENFLCKLSKTGEDHLETLVKNGQDIQNYLLKSWDNATIIPLNLDKYDDVLVCSIFSVVHC
jgi:hypothetical protein